MTGPEPPADEDARPDAARPLGSSWAWPVTLMVIAGMFIGGSIYLFKSCQGLPGQTLDKTTKLAQTLGEQAQKVASAFRQGTITTTFTSYATILSGSQYLQFATLSQQETFTRTDESTLLFGYIPLPDLIVEASAPVTYTYYLDLNAHWDFVVSNGVIWVTAPDIKFNKPALDVSRINYQVKKDSHFRNTSEAMENLRSSMTLMCYRKAQANIDLVRETGRNQTESFVANWLAKSFADGKTYAVRVRFRNEKPGIDPGPKPTRENAPGFSR